MAVITFPPAPVAGDEFTGSNDVNYRWDGVVWRGLDSGTTGGPFLPLAGGTMEGDIFLAFPPDRGYARGDEAIRG